jgi:uncharacterized phage-associated protein
MEDAMKPPASAFDASAFIIKWFADDESRELVTNLKLQKLLYFAQGIHGALTGERLFSESVEAWDLGPVVPQSYHEFKTFGRNPIVLARAAKTITEPKALSTLDIVCDAFGRYSAGYLVELTHTEPTWKSAFASRRNAEIAFEKMVQHFKAKWIGEIALDELADENALCERLDRALVSAEKSAAMSAEDMMAELGI